MYRVGDPQVLETSVQDLVFEASATDVRLKTALTSVSLLMNTQFIENVRLPP